MPIFTSVGASGSVGPTSGGKVYSIQNLGPTGSQVLAANPSRTSVTFHNPATGTGTPVPYIYVYPQVLANGTANPANLNLPGGSFVIFPGGLLTLTGEVQGAWSAFTSVSGTVTQLTVMESNLA